MKNNMNSIKIDKLYFVQVAFILEDGKVSHLCPKIKNGNLSIARLDRIGNHNKSYTLVCEGKDDVRDIIPDFGYEGQCYIEAALPLSQLYQNGTDSMSLEELQCLHCLIASYNVKNITQLVSIFAPDKLYKEIKE